MPHGPSGTTCSVQSIGGVVGPFHAPKRTMPVNSLPFTKPTLFLALTFNPEAMNRR